MSQKMTRVRQVGTTLSDGANIVSCRADGSITTVPPGSNGPAEQCAINGNIATYAPVDGAIYNFPFVQDVPNYAGWSGMYLIAL